MQQRSIYDPEREQLTQKAYQEAYAYLKAANFWVTKYNEVVGELHDLGHRQTPFLDSFYELIYALGNLPEIDINPPVDAMADASGMPQPFDIRQSPYLNYMKIPSIGRPSESYSELLKRVGGAAGWVCQYCQFSGFSPTSGRLGPDGRAWHVDHFYPRARGGDGEQDNLILACATCNISKNARLLFDFICELRQRALDRERQPNAD